MPHSRSTLCGLDLGQAGSFSALAVLEQITMPEQDARDYSVRHLKRFTIGTSFTDIAPIWLRGLPTRH